MPIVDLLQFISLMTVAVTLLISVAQNRENARQTRQLADQTRSLIKSVEQAAYQAANANVDTIRAFCENDQDMLRWVLAGRGYATSSHQDNKRIFYVMTELQWHERNYLGYRSGSLSADLWAACREVLKSDLAMPEFQLVWPRHKRFLAKPFVEYVDTQLAPVRP